VRESLAERELSLNLSDEAADLLVEKGWDPSMGARPLRRAIQRYIEDPLADEVLAQNAEPGSTVEVDKADRDENVKDSEDEVTISITKPARKREPVAVGAEGSDEQAGEDDGGSEEPEGSGGEDLPDDPDVLPDVPDAPPAPEDKDE